MKGNDGMKKFVKQLLQKGVDLGASDLYVFPHGEEYQLSLRVQQQKMVVGHLSSEYAEKLLLYFKYMGDMDVSEKRRIQIGSASVKLLSGRLRRIRLSTVSNYKNQESLVIRFLHDLNEDGELHHFFPKDFMRLRQMIYNKGLFLFCGETGSGKTTTMFSLAQELTQANRQVITIEDPVELYCEEFLQLQTNEKIDLSYVDLVQVCLRHRPDLMIVGEVRDEDTAKAVVRGALTGHTLFTTIHGLDKYSVLLRLLELGVNKEDVKQCLQAVVFQQILPVKCPYCKGDCSPYCPNKKNAVLFDIYSYEGGKLVGKKKAKSWQKKIKKIWALGYITDKTFHHFN